MQWNAMTVDVEDYFHVSAFEKNFSPKQWTSIPTRVDYNTHRLLDLFAEKKIKATFFTLGWVAQHCPDVIKAITAQGHEIASHGTNHRRATTMDHKALFADIAESKDRLEQLGGKAVIGYRAPSFSINETNTWAYDILAELGFLYSSSTYPVEHDLYGVPDWPREPYRQQSGIVEIPIPTIVRKNKNIGIGGGGYFRLYPYWLSKRRIQAFLNESSMPYNFYFHPWEIDPDQPRVEGAPLKSKLRHYVNLSVMEKKLSRLLDDFHWTSMAQAYATDIGYHGCKVPRHLSSAASSV